MITTQLSSDICRVTGSVFFVLQWFKAWDPRHIHSPTEAYCLHNNTHSGSGMLVWFHIYLKRKAEMLTALNYSYVPIQMQVLLLRLINWTLDSFEGSFSPGPIFTSHPRKDGDITLAKPEIVLSNTVHIKVFTVYEETSTDMHCLHAGTVSISVGENAFFLNCRIIFKPLDNEQTYDSYWSRVEHCPHRGSCTNSTSQVGPYISVDPPSKWLWQGKLNSIVWWQRPSAKSSFL